MRILLMSSGSLQMTDNFGPSHIVVMPSYKSEILSRALNITVDDLGRTRNDKYIESGTRGKCLT